MPKIELRLDGRLYMLVLHDEGYLHFIPITPAPKDWEAERQRNPYLAGLAMMPGPCVLRNW
jgi:hypothetical protein